MTSDCLFCKIAARELPAKIVYEDALALAFEDIAPQAPTHILVVSKMHLGSVADVKEPMLAGTLIAMAANIAERLGLDKSGYRLVINHGKDGGQTVHHFHVHLLGGRPMQWPPG